MDTGTRELKADIRNTREELGETLDAISEKIRPKAIVRRRINRMKERAWLIRDSIVGPGRPAPSVSAAVADRSMALSERMQEHTGDLGQKAINVKDTITGKASDMREKIGERTAEIKQTLGERTGEVTHTIGEKAGAIGGMPRSNPVAAGLIALGIGALAGSILRPSAKERGAADALRRKMEPLKQELSQSGQALAEGAMDAAKDAAEAMGSSLTDAASSVADTTRAGTVDLKDRSMDAAEAIGHRMSTR